MSGVLGVIAGNSSTYLVVGVASVGGGVFGFQNGNGSINGVTIDAPLRTAAIDLMRSITGGVAFSIELTSVVSQSFFKRIAVQTSAGTRTVLLASDATYSNTSGGTKSSWIWSGTALWDQAHASRLVEVSF